MSEKQEDQELCFYCTQKALYTDVAKTDEEYDIVGVCKCHYVQDVS